MSPKSPRLNADQIIAIIRRKGFVLERQSGSHRIFKNAKGARITIPYHGKKILHPKITAQIMKDAEIIAGDLD